MVQEKYAIVFSEKELRTNFMECLAEVYAYSGDSLVLAQINSKARTNQFVQVARAVETEEHTLEIEYDEEGLKFLGVEPISEKALQVATLLKTLSQASMSKCLKMVQLLEERFGLSNL